jgi:type IV pilus assembly protein PilV
MKQRASSLKTQQQAFTLIEVLVAMLLFSIALVTLASAYVFSLKVQQSAESQGVAALLANDLAARIRVNPGGAQSNAYDWDLARLAATATGSGRLACQGSTACTPAQIAAADLAAWQLRLGLALPQAQARVHWNAAQKSTDLWLAWRDLVWTSDGATIATEVCPSELTLTPSNASIWRCIHLQVVSP